MSSRVVIRDPSDEIRDLNCTNMLNQVRSTRQALLNQGVPEHAIIYIERNSPTDKNGTYYLYLEEIEEDIESARGLYIIPVPPRTTWDCFAVDGRDETLLVAELWLFKDYPESIEQIREKVTRQPTLDVYFDRVL
jgi:hypothetical protein